MIGKTLSSGKKIASGLVYSGPCNYYGFTCRTGKVSFVVTIYDNISEAGTEVEDYKTDANKEMDGHSRAVPVVCSKGLYLSLGGGSAIVFYVPHGEY